MKGRSTVVMIASVIILSGCGQATSDEKSSRLTEDKAPGYLGTLSQASESARKDIAIVTNARNDAIQKEINAIDSPQGGTREKDTLTTNTKTMYTTSAPEQIDMSLAQTCTGAKITTNHGVIDVVFYNDAAPMTVANFCTLAQMNFYDDVIFHRVIKDFMIQGGDPTGTGTGGPGYKFDDELPEAGAYKLGSLAMANAGPNTNGSQFFIVSGAAGVGLPPLYTLFGEVMTGMDVVEKIQNVETAIGDKPVEDVVIENIELVTK